MKTDPQNLLSSLNERQREAVTATEGPVLVVAGAGSGKTLVLTTRIAYLIAAQNVDPGTILAVTFTNKAAREMKERVARLLRSSGHAGAFSSLWVGTFHSICLLMIRAHAEKLGLSPRFVIFDEKDQQGLVKKAAEDLNIDTERFPPEMFLGSISKLKNRLISPDTAAQQAQDPFAETVGRVYARYQEHLRAHDAVDFDDMIAKTVELLERDSAARAQYRRQFRYILIDEYQDTNYAQERLARILAEGSRNICAVGDLDQAIYSWREADIAHILNFERTYPDAKVVLLEQNYRSTQTILSAANTIIKKNKVRVEKNLFTENGAGGKIGVVMVADENDEAAFVARTITELLRTGPYALSDFAVLYRTNAQSRALEETFMRKRIPYVVFGGLKFYARKEVKDLLAYLRFMVNPKDAQSLARIVGVPPRGIGKVALENYLDRGAVSAPLAKFFALIDSFRGNMREMPLSKLAAYVARHSGLERALLESKKEGESRWENVQELVSAASHYDGAPAQEALTRFLDNAALATDEDKEHADNAVRLMTIHSAKGLEFPGVFVVGMEDNVFPHARSKRSPEELEEERRLCYVAVTRAKEHLWLVCARARRLWGKFQNNPPSRFLFDVPESLIAFSAPGAGLHPEFSDLEEGIVDIA